MVVNILLHFTHTHTHTVWATGIMEGVSLSALHHHQQKKVKIPSPKFFSWCLDLNKIYHALPYSWTRIINNVVIGVLSCHVMCKFVLISAIELSLKETQHSPKVQSSLYPSTSLSSSGGSSASAEPRKVRALYDFEAVEENELTFASGEISKWMCFMRFIQSVCLSEHGSCHGDVLVDVRCCLCNKITGLGKTVEWTPVHTS